MQASVEEEVRVLMFGAELGDAKLRDAMGDALKERLILCRKEGRPLRVYTGYDPSSPDLHLGHSLTLRKMRQFQEFGHEVYFLVGTFTAQVGDASDKLTGRPRRSAEEVTNAARSYAEQCYLILDRHKTKVVYNGDWLSNLSLSDFVGIASNFTVQQFLARDNFRRRLDNGDVIGLHEFFYALLQGYDAHHLKADVQLGATEQLFNILAGRKLQEMYGEPPSICITFPILVGTDGTARMSKSTGNTVGLSEPANDQYGKTMSVSDGTMLNWIKYVTRWSPDTIEDYARQVSSGTVNPMEVKKKLAWEVASTYHGDAAADAAQAYFELVHQNKGLPEDIETVRLATPINIIDALTTLANVKSKSQARRLIEGGGVRLDDAVVSGFDTTIDKATLLRVGKRQMLRIEIGD